MNTHQAKKLVAASLERHNIGYVKLRARTVSFADLARKSAIFVTVLGCPYPEPGLKLVKKDLKGTGVLLDPNY